MDDVRLGRRIWYSFLAWLAGQGALGLVVFCMGVAGNPHTSILNSLDAAGAYVLISCLIGFSGWVLVGLPVALFWPVIRLRNTPYVAVFLIGLVAGPAVALIVVTGIALAHGEMVEYANSALFLICAAIVAPVCCLVYKLLVAKRTFVEQPAPPAL